MADRLVNLQPHLRAAQDDVFLAARALLSAEERHALFGDPRGVAEEVKFFHQFIAPNLVLPPEGVRVGPPLNLIACKGRGDESGAGLRLELMDLRARTREKELIDASKVHRRLGERNALHFSHLRIDLQQQVQASGHRDREGIDLAVAFPPVHNLSFRGQPDVLFLAQSAGPRDVHGLGSGSVDRRAAQLVGGRKAPGAVGNHPNAEAEGSRFSYLRRLAVLGGNVALPDVHDAHVDVAGLAGHCRIEGCAS